MDNNKSYQYSLPEHKELLALEVLLLDCRKAGWVESVGPWPAWGVSTLSTDWRTTSHINIIFQFTRRSFRSQFQLLVTLNLVIFTSNADA